MACPPLPPPAAPAELPPARTRTQMLAVLPASFSAFTLLPCGHVSVRAAPPSFRTPTPEAKDGLRRAAARRAVRRWLPGRGEDQVDEAGSGQVDQAGSGQVESVQFGSDQVGAGQVRSDQFDQDRRRQSALTFTESAEEEAALVKLQTMLSEDLPDATSTAWYPEVHGEVRLLRFLRKSKGSVDAASSRYREMLEWRRATNVDAVLSLSLGLTLRLSLILSLTLTLTLTLILTLTLTVTRCGTRSCSSACSPPTSYTSARCSA